MKPCVDCVAEGITTKRPIVSGTRRPRCSTHSRMVRKRARINAHARNIENTYQMTAQTYQALYELQGGVCFVCRKATGKARRLAVEHDHSCTAGHPPDRGCPQCWRALVCSRCNKLVAFLDVAALCRAIELLTNPPARRLR